MLFANPSLNPAEAAVPSSRRKKARAARTSRPWRPCWMACATSCPSVGPSHRPWFSNCANGSGARDCSSPSSWPERTRTTPRSPKFRDYFDYDEPIGRVPSHRALAVFRGRQLEILDAKLVLPVEPEPGKPSIAEGKIALHLGWSHQARPADDLLRKCVAWTWRVKLSLSTERDLFARLREEAEKVAIKVFADNLRDLLLAAPAGPRVVMGLDPGIRTGVKVAVVDATGKLVDTSTVYPHEPRRDWEGSLHQLGLLCRKHGVNLIAIGNGTASRETDKLAADLMKRLHEGNATRRGQRSRRLGLFGQRVRVAGNARRRREPARRRQHRAAPAGPAGRTGQDRSQVHRRGPVPARREPERAGAHARGRGGGLRELGGRGPEYRQRAVADAGFGPVGQRGQGRGALARVERRVPQPPAVDGCQRPGRQDLRAERGVPAHPRRRQPAGHDGRASGNLSGGGEDDGRHGQAGDRAHGPRRDAQDAEAGAVREREVRRHHRARTSWASWKSPAATRVPISRWRGSTMAWKTSPTCAKAWCWKAPSATWPPSAPSWTWACTRTGWSMSASWRTSSSTMRARSSRPATSSRSRSWKWTWRASGSRCP